MIRRITRFIFLSLVFVSGVLIGGIYTPEITSYSKAEGEQDKQQEGIRPLKKKPSTSKRIA